MQITLYSKATMQQQILYTLLIGLVCVTAEINKSVKKLSSAERYHQIRKRQASSGGNALANDPCLNAQYIEINDPRRSSSNVITSHLNTLDDGKFPKFWYRFTSPAGGSIPTTCPAFGSCGTVYPIYMNGAEPADDGQIHDTEMCTRETNGPTGCGFQCVPAKVKNCGNFFIYRLGSPGADRSAYCAGTESPCPAGQSSPNGYTPCLDVANIPTSPLPPTVELDESNSEKFFLQCKLNQPEAGVKHHVRWIADGNLFHSEELAAGQTVSKIEEDQMRFRGHTIVGYTVTCEVSARKQAFDIGTPYIKNSGDGYYLGLLVLDKQGNKLSEIVIAEDDTTVPDVYLKPTFPIRCNSAYWKEDLSQGFVDHCHVQTWVVNGDYDEFVDQLTGECTPEKKEKAVKSMGEQIEFGDCEVQMQPETWKEYLPHKVIIHAVQDRVFDGRQTRYVEFEVNPFYQQLWDGFAPPYLKVSIGDTSVPQTGLTSCKSFNDPHMTTFDGTKYDNYETGEFVLYEHKVYNIRIHAYFIKCNGIASCNCGVAAQAGDDVIIVDRCKMFGDLIYGIDNEESRTKGYLRQRVIQRGAMTQGFTLEHETNSRIYTIKFPHGAELKISLQNENFVNLELFPSQSDYSSNGVYNVQGLCGTFTKDQSDDLLLNNGQIYTPVSADRSTGRFLPHGFNQDWKISSRNSNRSMYNGQVLDTRSFDGFKFCACVRSSTGKDVVLCAFGTDCNTQVDLTEKLAQRTSLRRKRRSTGHDYVQDFDDSHFTFDLDTDPFQFTQTWPTPSGKTKQYAINYCTNLMNSSPSVQRCKNLNDVDIQSDIDMCVTDILLTDSLDFAPTAVLSTNTKCQEKVTSDMKHWKPNENLVFTDPQRLIDNTYQPPVGDFDSIAGASKSQRGVEPSAALLRPLMKIQPGAGSGFQDPVDTAKSYIPDQNVMHTLCPNDCSGSARGTCVSGQCSCIGDYIGSDCSGSRLAPNVLHLAQNGLCDTTTRPCMQTPVFGGDFAQSDHLTCHFKVLRQTSTGFQLTRQTLRSAAEFESYTEIHCPIPEALRKRRAVQGAHKVQAFEVAVSNDGSRFGAMKRLVIFDSSCMQCTTNSCQIKSGKCLIDGVCYDSGNRKPGDNCKKCQPSTSNYSSQTTWYSTC